MWQDRHGAGTLRAEDSGHDVVLAGWVHRLRDHGGLLFFDLRDRSGLCQITLDPQNPHFQKVSDLKAESTVMVRGTVRERSPEAVNPRLETGAIEVFPSEVEILSPSLPPPIRPTDEGDIDETLRLKYRYLDLRRPAMQKNILLRSRLLSAVRTALLKREFLEVETPYLTRSTPEGSRDFLVPSRMSKGHFYALPQSPQLFKQILMVAGMERYYQIVRCFRDEDLRADRQPEFTQIDIEMSFVDMDDVIRVAEEMVAEAFLEAAGWEVSLPFPRLTYDEAMALYGSDKPDLRFDLPIRDVSIWAKEGPVAFYKDDVAAGKRVKVLKIPAASALSRKEVESLGEALEPFGFRLAWVALEGGDLKGSLAKVLTPEDLVPLEASEGDLLLFASGPKGKVEGAMGALRLQSARKLGLIDPSRHSFLWVTDFPLFEWSEEEGRAVAVHHPFTSPRDEDLERMEKEPLEVRAKAYDIVLDGNEIGGGSIRIHRSDIQARVFKLLGLTDAEAQDKFGFLLEAFKYGPPPHGGIAFGFDRLVMLLAGADSIRDVIAFPKTSSGQDPLTGAPSEVSGAQLQELGIKTDLATKPPSKS